MMSMKSIGAFAVIIGCFAIVYPRFLHPFVLRAFGIQSSSGKEDDSQFPPHMRHKPSSAERKSPPMPHDPKDIRQHMRPGPHPGMRAAAEMQKQTQGSGRGMMGIVLPMYAIGICVYLIYTLFKVFNKRGKYPDPYAKRRVETDHGRLDSMGFPKAMQGYEGEQDYGEGEVQKYLRQKQQERELEDLLVKMDDSRNVSEDEMRALQKRLEETEAQMTRILQAMQNMQSRVGTMGQTPAEGEGPQGDDTSTAEDKGTDDKASGKVETVGGTASRTSSSEESQKESAEAQSRASSPDTDSYEIVKNSASAVHDTTPVSEVSSRSSFEQISKVEGMEPEEAAEMEEVGGGGGCEELVLGQKKKEEKDSNVRHRKTGHPEED